VVCRQEGKVWTSALTRNRETTTFREQPGDVFGGADDTLLLAIQVRDCAFASADARTIGIRFRSVMS
jgi:hypothetical protein